MIIILILTELLVFAAFDCSKEHMGVTCISDYQGCIISIFCGNKKLCLIIAGLYSVTFIT